MFGELRKNCGLGSKIPFPRAIYTDDNKNHIIRDEGEIAEKMVEIFTERASEANQRTSPFDGLVNRSSAAIQLMNFQIQFNDEIRADIETNVQLHEINEKLPVYQRKLLTSMEEITEITHERQAKKSFGHDQCSMFVIKRFGVNILLFLTILFNHCIANSHYPDVWKKSIIKPIPKIGRDCSIISNFRPIPQLCTFGKILEKIYEKKMCNHMRTNQLYDTNQFGFMSGHSSSHALATVQKTIIENLNRGAASIMVLLDIQAAFDVVWHASLIFKMLGLNFPLGILKFIQSYLGNRTCSVDINGKISSFKQLVAGTPQGGVLSALLFNIFIHDMPDSPGIQRTNFADDTSIIQSTLNFGADKQILQNAINKIVNFLGDWKIRLNPNKCEMLPIIGSCKDTKQKLRRQCKTNHIEIYNTKIPIVLRAKYLGVVFAQNARFDRHIDHITRKINIANSKLRGILNRRDINKSVRILLYRTLLSPIITYACPIWFNETLISSHQVERLRIIERKALRAATGIYRTADNQRYIKSSVLYEFVGDRRIDVKMVHLTTKFFDCCDESPYLEIQQITNIQQNNPNDKYKQINMIQRENHDGQLFIDGKFLKFNQKRFQNGVVYITDQ